MTHEFMTIALWSKQRKGMGCFTGNYSLFMTHDFRTNEHVKTIYLSLLGTPGGGHLTLHKQAQLSLSQSETLKPRNLYLRIYQYSVLILFESRTPATKLSNMK